MTPCLHHVALGSRDVAALAAFYTSLLQIAERKRHLDERGELRSVWLDLSGVLLMIERADSSAERPRVEGVGLGAFLLAFRADGPGRRLLEERAAQLGAAIEARSPYTSYLRDPEGNRLAVSEYELEP